MGRREHITEDGFTLLELLIAVTVIALLAGMALVTVGNIRPKARDTKRLVDIKQLQLGLDKYYDENNEYPSSGGTWRCLGHTSSETCWYGAYSGLDTLNTSLYPYIQKIPDDPRNKNCYGDAYLYNSNHGSISGRPAGVYLHWYFETGEKSDKSCGSGFYGGENSCGPYCWLYVGGPGIP